MELEDIVLVPKESFVGTAIYMAPEMILNKKTGPSCDLWAFGLILYKMITGKSLFGNIKEYVLYDIIKNGKFEIKEDFDEEAKDLILKLLNLDPEKRLGAGPKGAWNSFENLKDHPFFKNKKGSNKIICELSTESTQTSYEIQKKILLRGIVGKKRNFWFYDNFELILFNDGSLNFYSLKKKILKTSINLNHKCISKIESKNFFSIKDEKEKSFTFKMMDKTEPELWIKEINKFIH